MDVTATILIGIKLRDDWYSWMEEQVKGHAGAEPDDLTGLYALKKGVHWNIKDGETYESFFNKKLKAIKDMPCELVTFSHYDSDDIDFFLALRHYEVDGCYGMEVEPFDLQIHNGEARALRDFCKIMGIEYSDPRIFIGANES